MPVPPMVPVGLRRDSDFRARGDRSGPERTASDSGHIRTAGCLEFFRPLARIGPGNLDGQSQSTIYIFGRGFSAVSSGSSQGSAEVREPDASHEPGQPDQPASAPRSGAAPDSAASQADFGANEWLVEELYQRYLADPGSVDRAWWSFFADFQPTLPNGTGPQPVTGPRSAAPAAPAPAVQPPPAPPPQAPPPQAPPPQARQA